MIWSDAENDLPAYLKTSDLVARWQISARTLERWRIAGTGPAWARLGDSVRYHRADVLAWEDAQRR